MDLTTGLTRLLSDRALREEFKADPEKVSAALGIDEDDWKAFRSLDPEGLDAQANTLLSKRLWEVSGLLRATMRGLGAQARPRFMAFAEAFWPRDHRRHFEDAVAFCDYLKKEGAGEVCRAEENWVRYVLEGKRFRVHWVREFPAYGSRRWALQILYRNGEGYPRDRAFFFR